MNEFALTVNFVPTAGGAHRAQIPNGIDLSGNWEAMIINSKVDGKIALVLLLLAILTFSSSSFCNCDCDEKGYQRGRGR